MKISITLFLYFVLVGSSIGQTFISIIDFENNIALTGTIETFIPSKHKIDTCYSGQNQKVICLIDGKIWYGNAFALQLPQNQLTKLTIKINDKEIDLDVSGMFNPNLSNILAKDQFKIEKTNTGYVLYAYFSDGAGTYTTKWKIVKGKSLRTKISIDEGDFNWQLNK